MGDFAAELHHDAAGWPAKAQQHHDGAVVAYWHERATQAAANAEPSDRV